MRRAGRLHPQLRTKIPRESQMWMVSERYKAKRRREFRIMYTYLNPEIDGVSEGASTSRKKTGEAVKKRKAPKGKVSRAIVRKMLKLFTNGLFRPRQQLKNHGRQ